METTVDRALWITWYDLPEAGRDQHLAWLQDMYTPTLLERPGFLWATHFQSEMNPPMSGVPAGGPSRLHSTSDPGVPRGNAYILIFGAETPHAFGKPTPTRLHAELPAEDRSMLEQRVGARMNIMVEEDRADGPEAGKRDSDEALSPCIQLGSFNAGSADDEEVLAWYAQWRLPSLQKLPGCVRIRKLVSVAGWAKHGVLYEFSSLEARNAHFPDHEKPNPEMNAWTDSFVRKLLHAPGSPNVAQRIASAVAEKRA
jgi:hypothetical protein